MNRRSFLGWAGKAAVAVGLASNAAEAAEAAPQTGIQFTAQPGVLSMDNARLTVKQDGVIDFDHASAMGGIVAGGTSHSGWIKVNGHWSQYWT